MRFRQANLVDVSHRMTLAGLPCCRNQAGDAPLLSSRKRNPELDPINWERHFKMMGPACSEHYAAMSAGSLSSLTGTESKVEGIRP